MKTLERSFNYGLLVAVIVICIYGALQAREFQDVSRWFPMFAGVVGAALAGVVLLGDVISQARRPTATPVHASPAPPATHVPVSGSDAVDEALTGTLPSDAEEKQDEEPRSREVLLGFAFQFSWFIGFAVLLVLFSLLPAVFVWLVLVIRLVAKETWLRAVVSGLAMTTFLFLLSAFLGLALPEGLVFDSSVFIPIWRL